MAEERKEPTGVQEGTSAPAAAAPPKEPEGGPNAVAERFGELMAGLKKVFTRNVVIACCVLALAVALFFVWRYFAGVHADQNAELWFRWERAADLSSAAQLEFARNDQGDPIDLRARAEIAQLEKFAKENPGTMPARLARFQIARAFLYQGVRDLGAVNPNDAPSPVVVPEDPNEKARKRHDDALAKLREAAKRYKELADESGDVALLAQEALLNGGKALESLAEFDKARASYKELMDKHGKSRLAGIAVQGVARLDEIEKNPELKERLTRLAQPAAPTR
jgi:predicted negative regulator of RcsB-dependent stress response